MSNINILFDVWLIQHLVQSLLDQRLASSGLTADDFGLYSLLMRSGPVNPMQLTRWTGMRPTTISAALKRMDAHGDLVKTPHPADRRSYQIALSDTGKARYQAALLLVKQVMVQLDAQLGSLEHDLRVHLQQLDTALRQINQSGPRPYTLQEATPSLVSEQEEAHQLSYRGLTLTAQEEAEVLHYLSFIQSKRHSDRKEALDVHVSPS